MSIEVPEGYVSMNLEETASWVNETPPAQLVRRLQRKGTRGIAIVRSATDVRLVELPATTLERITRFSPPTDPPEFQGPPAPAMFDVLESRQTSPRALLQQARRELRQRVEAGATAMSPPPIPPLQSRWHRAAIRTIRARQEDDGEA